MGFLAFKSNRIPGLDVSEPQYIVIFFSTCVIC